MKYKSLTGLAELGNIISRETKITEEQAGKLSFFSLLEGDGHDLIIKR